MALYQKFPVNVEGTTRGIVLRGSNGSANLVAIYNLITFFHGSDYGHPSPVSGRTLKGIISNALHQAFEQLEDISASQIKEVKKVLTEISTDFSLKPCMRAHLDFENNAAYMLCRILGLKVFHTWVLNPEINNYEIIKDLSHAELVEYCHDKEDQDGHLKDLLNDSANQLTSYGYNSLANELKEDSLSLIFCRNQLDIIHKHDGVLYLLVTDEDLHNQMPTALWMVFEEHQENNIFFNASYAPVEGQPCEQRAQDFCTNLTRKCEKNAARNRLKKAKRKAKRLQLQKGESNGASLESSESSKTAANEGEVQVDTKSSVDEDKGAETVVSHPIEDLGFTGSSHEENKIKEESQEGFEASMCQVSCKEGVDVAEGLGFIGSSKEQDKSEEESQEVVDASVCQVSSKKGVDVAESVAYDFLMFLMDFKDNGCSEPYFKGIVAAFSSHAPLFYVPYEFIMEYNEDLALKIQDNYSGISEDLKESVVCYLSLNEVTFTDPVLKIIGLPEPKSVRSFLDFVDSIVLHEHYQVYGMDPEALPSYDSRRMCLGYLNSIVAKFRTGRCWDGEWSEDNMKVKNKGLEFAIDCEKDYELTAERGYHDLLKFSTTVLERLRFNGRLPPYFDSFSADIMLINRCFGNPVKWDRFLELISYPLALKPPLVRASFICNIYLVANANSSGTPRYAPFYSRMDCSDWRKSATENELLKEVYDYLETCRSKRLNHILDEWSVSHWHVFKFSRHFIQHVLQDTKGQDLIQKVKDISIVDILLSRTIWIALAKSVTFLVLNCGVDGLFSSAWRHYVGSDYSSVDMPNLNLEDATTSDMVQELVDTISEVKKTAYVCSEISVFSKPKNLSVIIGDADLIELKLQLNNSGFKCNLAGDGCLQCGSITLSKHTKRTNGRTFLLVEGPYSPEYNSIFAFVIEQLCL